MRNNYKGVFPECYGKVTYADYEGYTSMADMAERIANDLIFEARLRRILELKAMRPSDAPVRNNQFYY